MNAGKENASAAAIESQNCFFKLLESAVNKLTENFHPNSTMGCDKGVDQALEQLLYTVETKERTRSQGIQYITTLLGSYDYNNSAPEVEETEEKLSRVRINEIICLIILQYFAKLKTKLQALRGRDTRTQAAQSLAP